MQLDIMADTPAQTARGGFDLGREAVPAGQGYRPTAEEMRLRKRRNYAIAGLVAAFVILVFGITTLRLQQNIKASALERLYPPPAYLKAPEFK